MFGYLYQMIQSFVDSFFTVPNPSLSQSIEEDSIENSYMDPSA
jgi:hypothetical protein